MGLKIMGSEPYAKGENDMEDNRNDDNNLFEQIGIMVMKLNNLSERMNESLIKVSEGLNKFAKDHSKTIERINNFVINFDERDYAFPKLDVSKIEYPIIEPDKFDFPKLDVTSFNTNLNIDYDRLAEAINKNLNQSKQDNK